MQFMRDEREKNSKIELLHTPMLENETPEQWNKRVSEEFPIKLNQLRKEQAEATLNFLKEHIISKERFYQLIEEYHNDNNTVSILQEDYKQRSLHTGKELEKILAETREIREKGFLRHDYIEKTLERQPYLNEYAELVNHKDNLFILELATGGGYGLYPVLKTLQSNSRVICADRELTSMKIADAIADNMGLSDRVFG